MACLIIIISCTLIGSILYTAFLIYYQYTYWKRRKILHIELVPILGNNAPLFLRSTSFAIHTQNLYKRYPSARWYGLFDFNSPTVILKDPNLIREICIKSFEYFVDHDTFVTEEMDPIIGCNLFSLKGQRWREIRNIITPSFTSVRMKIMFELIIKCSHDFIQYFIEHPEVANNFEAKDAFTRYTNDVIAITTFGFKVNSMKDQNNEFYLHGKAATSFTKLELIKFELLRRFPTFMRCIGATFLPKATDQFFRKLIENIVKTRKEKNIVQSDMIQLLMQFMNKKNNVKVTVNDIVGQAFFFFMAGFDTTSSLICFIVQELAANPHIQEKLHREIERQIEVDDGEVSYDSLIKIKYLDMVINETLRMYPPAPTTNRICIKNYNFPAPMQGYPKYCMEKGTIIMISFFGLHRDPKYFPEPDKFNPERFNDDNKRKIDPYTYLPFGIGPRRCLGNLFALMKAKIVIIDILRNFVIKFTKKSENPIIFDTTSFTITAKNGFWFNFEERKKKN